MGGREKEGKQRGRKKGIGKRTKKRELFLLCKRQAGTTKIPKFASIEVVLKRV